MSINHVAYEVPRQKLAWEVQFWKSIGFGRITRPSPKPVTTWLNDGNGTFIHLLPVDVDRDPLFPNDQWSHVAIVLNYALTSVLDGLDRLPFRVQAEEAEPWWGARRVFVHSPAGYRVELLEYAPPAVWPGAPLDD